MYNLPYRSIWLKVWEVRRQKDKRIVVGRRSKASREGQSWESGRKEGAGWERGRERELKDNTSHLATCLLFTIPQFSNYSSSYRAPKISTLQEIYAEVGFLQGPAIVLTSLYFKPEQYYNEEGPFNKDWRNTDRYINKSQCMRAYIHTHTHTHTHTHSHTHTHTCTCTRTRTRAHTHTHTHTHTPCFMHLVLVTKKRDTSY